MSSLDPAYLMLVLEQQEKAAQALLPAFRAVVESKQQFRASPETALSAKPSPLSQSVQTGGQAPETAAAKASAPAGAGLQAMLSLAQNLNANKTAKSTPELSADPLLFKTPLMNKDDVWDSIKATSNSQNVDVFLRQLPSFSNDARNGCNTLVLRAQMISLSSGGFERQWAGINIGRAPSKEAAADALRDTLLGHVYWRVDPVKLGQKDDPPTFKYRYGQTFKQTGRWSNDVKKDRAFSLITWPFKTDKSFFIRLILHPWGMLSYVDGKFFSYTPYPGFQAPKEGETLYLQIPVAGDAGEKPTWKILSAHWGSCRPDVDGERSMVEYINSDVGRAAMAAAKVESEDEIYITGVPPAASEALIVETFKQWGAISARRDPARPGAATVKLALGSFPSLKEVVAQTHAKVNIQGAAINVSVNLTAVKLYRPQPAPPTATGAGAGAGSSMAVGFAPFGSSAQMQTGSSPAFSASAGGASSGSGGAGYSGLTPASATGGSDRGGGGVGSSPAYNPTSPAYGEQGGTSPAYNPTSPQLNATTPR